MFPDNPYITGKSVGNSPAFVGRDDVLREVVRVLRLLQDNAIVLFGQRRIGKTSILRELEAKLPTEGNYCPIFFDLLDKAQQPLGEVLQELAQIISDVLQQEAPDLGADPETTFRQVWLPELLKKLPPEKTLVLLFDEFDVLDDPKVEQAAGAFFPYLRHLLSIDPKRLNFVFAIGRKIDDLNNIALSLFKEIATKRVSLLNHENTVKLVRLSETNQTLNWTNDAIEKIWQQTSGHPYLTQRFCSHVWNNLYDKNPGKRPTATLKEVEIAWPEVLDASRSALEWLWDGLGSAERIVASALAEKGANPITEVQLKKTLSESGVRMMIRELQNAPRILQDWDLIEAADGGYRFRVELLRRWIAEYKPLNQVQNELDRIEPVADDLYNAAKIFYANHKLYDALTSLRQAVSSNPNHVGANLLLADILLAKKQSFEACEILERLYTYQSSAAVREKWVQALLALAQSVNRKKEQIKLYKRVLVLDAGHPEAKSQLRKIQRRRENASQRQWAVNLKGIFHKYLLGWKFWS
jgi:tetratricopeptide (TPR) repeat protein